MLDALLTHCSTHVLDALHERTYGRTNAEHPHQRDEDVSVSDARETEPRGFVYVVHWPTAEFTKIGCSVDGRRWRPFLRRGGELLAAFSPTELHYTLVEWRMHVDLGASGVPRKFLNSADAKPYLGGSGRGFSECYVDRSGHDVLGALVEIELSKPERWGGR